MGLRTIQEVEEERRFGSEEEKVGFLGEVLDMHEGFRGELDSAGRAEYDYTVDTPDGRTLYFGGFMGVLGGICDRVPSPITESMVQNMVCTGEVLRIPKGTGGLDAYDDRFLEFVVGLDSRGLIRGPRVRVDLSDPEGGRKAMEELGYASLTNAADFVSRLRGAYHRLWEPKLRENTGEYDPSHIRYRIAFAVE